MKYTHKEREYSIDFFRGIIKLIPNKDMISTDEIDFDRIC